MTLRARVRGRCVPTVDEDRISGRGQLEFGLQWAERGTVPCDGRGIEAAIRVRTAIGSTRPKLGIGRPVTRSLERKFSAARHRLASPAKLKGHGVIVSGSRKRCPPRFLGKSDGGLKRRAQSENLRRRREIEDAVRG